MSVALKCLDDIKERVATIPKYSKKVFHVVSEEGLLELTKGVNLPCAGIVYDGILPVPETNGSYKIGGSGELFISVVIMFKQLPLLDKGGKVDVVEDLDAIRNAILETKSPTNHRWRFVAEVAVEGRKGILAYVQRWATPVQLVYKQL